VVTPTLGASGPNPVPVRVLRARFILKTKYTTPSQNVNESCESFLIRNGVYVSGGLMSTFSVQIVKSR
jgi:hypothetical protein